MRHNVNIFGRQNPINLERGVERPIFAEDCGGAETPDGDGTEERVDRQPVPRTAQLMAQILIQVVY